MACKAGIGITKCVLQDDEKNPVSQRPAQGTVNAADLEVDPGCTNLIASRVYDMKTVHYLSIVSE